MTDALTFLTTWFRGCTGSVQFLAIDPTSKKDPGYRPPTSLWVPGPDYDFAPALAWAERCSTKRRNVYFSVCTHRPGTVERTSETAVELPGLFADVDFKHDGHEKTEAYVKSHTARLSLAVDSGGGIHPYAKFAVPVAITPENAAHLEARVAAFGRFLNNGNRPERFDLASVLRVPGTINWPDARKSAAGRVPTETSVLLLTDDTFQPSDFNDLPTTDPDPEEKPDRITAALGTLPADWEERLQATPDLLTLWDLTAEPTGEDTSLSAFNMRLANSLCQATSYSDAEVLAILAAHYVEHGRHDKSLKSLQITLGKARARARRRRAAVDCTDVGNSRLLVAKIHEDFRYVADRKRWLQWEGTRWADDDGLTVTRHAVVVSDELKQHAAAHPANRALTKWAAASAMETHVRAMVSLAKAAPEVAATSDLFDRDDLCIPFLNGVLDLRDYSMRPHDRANLNTYTLDFAFDEDAADPAWQAFLDMILPDRAEQRALQQAFGRCLTPEAALRWLLIICGVTGSGKSTLIDTVGGTLGPLAKHIQYNALRRQRRGGSSPSPEIAKLRGAKLVFANEGGGNIPLDTELVKQMTGGDSMSGRALYENEITFRANFLLALVSNAPPRLPIEDGAIWDRLVLFNFNHKIANPKQNVAVAWKATPIIRPTVFTWMLNGLDDFRTNGPFIPDTCRLAKDELWESDNIVGDFLREKCTPGGRTERAELYSAFVMWSFSLTDDGERARRKGRGWFYAAMAANGRPTVTVNGTRYLDLTVIR